MASLELIWTLRLPFKSVYFKFVCFSIKTLNLWHDRLGHANFQYLCWFFPLKKACQKVNFTCGVCELSKHTRTTYIFRMHHAPSAFDLIHSNVWGPSLVTTLS